MAKRDKVFVCIISNLTDAEAYNMASAFGKAKNRFAALSRGVIEITNREGVRKALQTEMKKLSG